MLEDNPINTSLKLQTEKYNSDKLSGINLTETRINYIEVNIPEYEPVSENTKGAKEFLYELCAGSCENTVVNEIQYFSRQKFSEYKLSDDIKQVHIRGCRFTNLVFFQSEFCDHNVVFEECVFEKTVDARNFKFDKSVTFINCAFNAGKVNKADTKRNPENDALDFSLSNIKGNLSFRFCRIYGRFSGENLNIRGIAAVRRLFYWRKPK